MRLGFFLSVALMLLVAACTNTPRQGTDFCQGTSLACANTFHNHGGGGRNG